MCFRVVVTVFLRSSTTGTTIVITGPSVLALVLHARFADKKKHNSFDNHEARNYVTRCIDVMGLASRKLDIREYQD